MKINTTVGNVQIKIDTKRLDKSLAEAQKLLNLQIASDCDPLIPFQQGALRNSVNYPDGIYGGLIEYNTVYAHYIYTGLLYKGSHPIKDSEGNITGWWSEPKKTPTNKPLHYHHPGSTGHWFEEAKKQHKNEWVDLVKKTAGKE